MRISRAISCRSAASRLDSGSSSSSSRGWIASARASATRCCWPPDSARGSRVGECFELDQPQHLGDARVDGGLAQAPHLQPERDVARDRQMREQRVALEHDAHLAADAPAAAGCWRRPGGCRPTVGCKNPAIMRSVVVLPQPDGPSSTISSPGAIDPATRRPPRHARRNACQRVAACRAAARLIAPPWPSRTKRSSTSSTAPTMHHLRHRDRRDQRVDMVFKILQHRDRQRGDAGAARNSAISRLSNEMMKANSPAAMMPGRIAGSVTRQITMQRCGAEAGGGFLGGAVVVGQAGEAQPHHPGRGDQDVRQHQPAGSR